MGLLSNSVVAHPYQNQTWVPPPGPDPKPNRNSVGLTNLFEFGQEIGKITLRFKEASDSREVRLIFTFFL